MTRNSQQSMLNKIGWSINTHGYHVTIVQGGPLPKFAYTTGLHVAVGFEIVFAGGAFYTCDEMIAIVKELARRVVTVRPVKMTSEQIDGIGAFSFRSVDATWVNKMMLGPLRFYNRNSIDALQILPSKEYWTIDIPDMRDPWDPTLHTLWKWLECPWEYSVSPQSQAITNLTALRGEAITEVMRWEETEWEMFSGAGCDVNSNDVRIVPLGTMLGYDSALVAVANLAVGSGCWRLQGDGEWHPWENHSP